VIRKWQDHEIARWEDIARLAVECHTYAAVLLADRELAVVARQQHALIELVGQAPHQRFHGRKIEDEPAVLFEPALDDAAGPIVMAVQRLAAVTGERNEVR